MKPKILKSIFVAVLVILPFLVLGCIGQEPTDPQSITVTETQIITTAGPPVTLPETTIVQLTTITQPPPDGPPVVTVTTAITSYETVITTINVKGETVTITSVKKVVETTTQIKAITTTKTVTKQITAITRDGYVILDMASSDMGGIPVLVWVLFIGVGLLVLVKKLRKKS